MANVSEAIRRLTVEARTVGVKEAEQAARGLANAVDGVAVSSTHAEKATQSMEGRLASIQRKYDAQYRAQMEQVRVEKSLAAAQAQGLITVERRMELLSLAGERNGLATAAITRQTQAMRQQAQAAAANTSQIRNATAATNQLAAANDNLGRGGGLQTANIAAQFQDIGVTSALGMSPIQIALQQGTQLQAVLGPMGAAGAVRALGTAFVSLINPVSLATLAFVGITAAAIQYFMRTEEESKATDMALKAHAEAISALKEAYGAAASGAREYLGETKEMARALTIVAGVDLKAQFEAQAQAIIDGGALVREETEKIKADIERVSEAMAINTDTVRGTALYNQLDDLYQQLENAGSGALAATARFEPFRAEIERFIGTVQKGQPDFIALREAIGARINTEPNNAAIAAMGGEILNLIGTASQLQSAMAAGAQSLDRMGDAAARNVGSIITLTGAMQALGAMIPEVARAQQVQAKLTEANIQYQAGVKALSREIEAGSMSFEQSLAAQGKLNDLYNQAQAEVTGLTGALTDLERREQEAARSTLPAREAAAARIRDQYQKLEADLRAAGASEQDVARATAAMNAELAVSASHFEKISAKAGSRGAAKALKDAEREALAFLRVADGLTGEFFPAEKAKADAIELIGMLDLYGDKLNELQRRAVEMKIDQLFSNAGKEAEDAAKQIEETLGSVLSDLFSKPIKDFDEFMDRVTSGFAQLGQANLQKAFDGMFSGSSAGAANDNFQANTTFGEFIGSAVEKGAKAGTAEGGFRAFASGIQALFGGNQQAGGGMQGNGALSAGLGGFGMGYQSQSPVMGGLGGALSGFAAGGPIGAIVGGVAGLLGGIFGGNAAKKKERAEANSQLNQNTAVIDQLFAAGQGRGIGDYANAVREFYDETAKIDEIAQKAGDGDLVARLRQNFNDFFLLMEKDFVRSWSGMVDALNDGLGSNSPFVKGKESIEGLRDELKNFVADTQAMGDLQLKHGRDTDAATVAAQVETARQAAQTMALAVLGGAKTLSTMESEMLRLDGVAAGLQVTLEELGMSADTAGKAISSSLDVAVAKLRDTFRTDINASINELSGFGYLNDIAEAQIVYQQRLSDAAALGLDGSLAARELSLSLKEIVSSAGLTTAEINMLAGAFPALAGMVSASTVSLTSAQNDLRAAYDAEASALDDLIDRTESFIDTIRKFRDNMRLSASSPLSPAQRVLEAQRQFRSVSALAASGDENAQSQLTGISQAYLDEARSYYASSENYMRIWEEVDATLAGTQSTAERQLTESQKQLAALNAQVSGLITINTSVLSVGAAISQLSGAQSALGTQIAAMASTGSDAIGAAYQSSLGRTGGASEVAYWQSQIAAGKSVDWAVSAIANSAEAQALKSIRGFASGGMHMGGLRLVGENGPEIEATGPSRIYSAPQTRAMLANDNSAVVAELRELRAENARLSKAVERLGSMVKLSDEETRKVIREGNATMAETSSALKKVASR
jgi:hypothetical protein